MARGFQFYAQFKGKRCIKKTVGVVVPAYNEEKLIGHTLDAMPDFVDKIIVVDDCSGNAMTEHIQKRVGRQPGRIILI